MDHSAFSEVCIQKTIQEGILLLLFDFFFFIRKFFYGRSLRRERERMTAFFLSKESFKNNYSFTFCITLLKNICFNNSEFIVMYQQKFDNYRRDIHLSISHQEFGQFVLRQESQCKGKTVTSVHHLHTRRFTVQLSSKLVFLAGVRGLLQPDCIMRCEVVGDKYIRKTYTLSYQYHRLAGHDQLLFFYNNLQCIKKISQFRYYNID